MRPPLPWMKFMIYDMDIFNISYNLSEPFIRQIQMRICNMVACPLVAKTLPGPRWRKCIRYFPDFNINAFCSILQKANYNPHYGRHNQTFKHRYFKMIGLLRWNSPFLHSKMKSLHLIKDGLQKIWCILVEKNRENCMSDFRIISDGLTENSRRTILCPKSDKYWLKSLCSHHWPKKWICSCQQTSN